MGSKPCLLVFAFVMTVCFGCASLGTSAVDAAKDPQTWVPLLGAAVIAITNVDDELAEDAQRDTPIFRDPQGSSGDLRDLLALSYLASAALVPRDDGQHRLAAFGANVGGYLAANVSVGALKEVSGRRRPDDTGDTSFPSGHAANASYLASATGYNLARLNWPRWSRRLTHFGLQGAAVGSAWGRLEAGKHFPSDVLAGYALGHFFATWVERALATRSDRLAVQAQAMPDGVLFGVTLRLP